MDKSERPWGFYEVLIESAGYKVKQITVFPGKRLSLQTHDRRSEHWVIARGSSKVTIGTTICDLRDGDSIDIPLGCPHRIENIGQHQLVFIEVQIGDYLGEDDIKRLDDDFGRAK